MTQTKRNPYKDLYEKTLALNTEYRELLKAYKALLDAYVNVPKATFVGAPSSGCVHEYQPRLLGKRDGIRTLTDICIHCGKPRGGSIGP